MHSKSDNIRIMISDEADEVIKQFIKALIYLKIDIKKIVSMKGREFVFDYVKLLYYKRNKINLNCGGSYLDSPD